MAQRDTQSIKNLSGREKASVLLITLGPEKSAKIFKHLKEEEIEMLTLQIANTTSIMPEIKDDVLDEFYQLLVAQQYITEGGLAYAREILEQALGEEKANEIIANLTVSLQTRPFDFIRSADASQVLTFIQHEHPQVIALVLSYMKPEQAAEILVDLEPEIQAEVARRIAIMDRTTPDVVKEVENALEKKLSNLTTEEYAQIGGVDSLVEILNVVDRVTEKNIMEAMESEDMELSEEIRRKMFVFEDLLTLDNFSIRTVLMQDIDTRELAVALKGATEPLKELILANVSKRMAAMIEEEIEFLGPVRRSDVEEAQQKIVNIVRRLQDSGEIIVARGGGDEIIV